MPLGTFIPATTHMTPAALGMAGFDFDTIEHCYLLYI
jgi:hypothetical protein